MERIEMVEKIRKQANISLEEAKDVLERNGWDILDAMVELERAGKIRGGAETSTENKETEYDDVSPTVSVREAEREQRKRRHEAFRVKLKKAVRVLIDNRFVVKNKYGELLVRMPVIVPIICALAAIWLTAIVLIAGLIFGLRYSFEGKELGKKAVNDGMEKASKYTQNIVNNIIEKDSSEQGEDIQDKEK